jgi:uncharacterized membrane protein YphA (DoxX/SURF4 family)
MKIAKAVTAWILAILLFVMFAHAGVMKFDPNGGWTRAFHNWGYPDWFRVAVGAAEVVAALLLLLPRTAKFGAAIIIVLMLGGIGTNLMHGGMRRTIGSVIPLLLASALLALRYTATPPLASASSSRE